MDHKDAYGLKNAKVDYNENGYWEITSGGVRFHQSRNDLVLRYLDTSTGGETVNADGVRTIDEIYISQSTLRGGALKGGADFNWEGGVDVWGGFSLGSKNGVTWGEVKDWIHLRTSSPRNFLRWSFNTIESIGTGVEIVGLGAAPFTGGVSLALTIAAFPVNTVGVVGNSFIDLYDGKTGSAIFSIGRHAAFYGLGKVANSITGGATDELMLQGILFSYNNYLLPLIGRNYALDNTNSTFERVEYTRP